MMYLPEEYSDNTRHLKFHDTAPVLTKGLKGDRRVQGFESLPNHWWQYPCRRLKPPLNPSPGQPFAAADCCANPARPVQSMAANAAQIPYASSSIIGPSYRDCSLETGNYPQCCNGICSLAMRASLRRCFIAEPVRRHPVPALPNPGGQSNHPPAAPTSSHPYSDERKGPRALHSFARRLVQQANWR